MTIRQALEAFVAAEEANDEDAENQAIFALADIGDSLISIFERIAVALEPKQADLMAAIKEFIDWDARDTWHLTRPKDEKLIKLLQAIVAVGGANDG